MTRGANIGLIVGGVVVLGVGLYFLLRPKRQQTYIPPPPYPTDSSGKPQINWGALVSNIIDSLPSNQKQTISGGQVVVTEPTTKSSISQVLQVDASKYTKDQIKKMQNYLMSMGGQPKMWVETTGGADGIIGNGFRQAYTWAVITKKITDMNDLQQKAGA
tara:strand:+ start:56 stop:535 length:480 start_codon:yes stop_codon:yes gene_type:complete